MLVIVLSLSTLVTNAQFETGQKVLGGNMGFSLNKGENLNNLYLTYVYTNLSVSPSFSWFNKPNRLVGVGLSYGYYNYKETINNQTTDAKVNSIGLNIFSQRFLTLTQKLFFTLYTGASASYSFGKRNNTVNNSYYPANTNSYSVSVNFAPGISYRLTQRLLFDASLSNLIYLSYFHNETKYKNVNAPSTNSTQNSFNLSSSLSSSSLANVGLGFRWLLKRK